MKKGRVKFGQKDEETRIASEEESGNISESEMSRRSDFDRNWKKKWEKEGLNKIEEIPKKRFVRKH